MSSRIVGAFRMLVVLLGLAGAASAQGQIVISQIYTAGGGAGAPWRNDYIELFNRGTTPVNLTNWSVQYAAPAGSVWAATGISGAIAPGQYYLVQEGSSGSNGVVLPTPDATGTINLTPANGKIALVAAPTSLPNAACFPIGSNAIVDFVGYGPSANCFEGAGPAASPSTTTAIYRLGGGCIDTDSNSADFVIQTPPNPRNSTTPISPCSPVVGACCINNNCGQTTQANCLNSSGSYHGDGSVCTPTLCAPSPTGACCIGSTCLETTSTNCLGSSGTYFGDNSVCMATLCITGACCVGTACSIQSAGACALSAGVYRGDNTTCTAGLCVVGACCIAGNCQMLSESDCSTACGIWGGSSASCTAGLCSAVAATYEPPTMDSPPAGTCSEGGSCSGQSDRGCINSVYLFSGEAYCSAVDLRIRGRGLDFVWARKYRSRNGPTTAMGEGWDFSYNIRLCSSGTDLILRDGNTRQDRYVLQPDGSYGQDGFFRELRQNADMTWTLLFADTGKWNFFSLADPTRQGRISSIVDRNGNTIQFTYDALGRLVTIIDSLGRVINVAYDGSGYVSSISDFTGRQVIYTHDAAGNLTAVRSPIVSGTPNGNDFPAGKTTTYSYSTGFADPRLNHNLLSITDPLGQTYLTNVYASTTNPTDVNFDRVTRQIWGNPTDIIDVVYVPQAGGVMKAIVNDRVGDVKEFYYDAGNRLIQALEYTGRAVANQPTTETTNRPTGQLRPGDPVSFVTNWFYNADSLVTDIAYPNGNSVHRSYELDLNPSVSRRLRGNMRQVTRSTGPLGGDQPTIAESFTYETNLGGCGCGASFVKTHTNARGFVTMHTYDGFGNRIHTDHPPGGGVEDWTYNSFGQLTSHTFPANNLGHRRVDTCAYYSTGFQNGYMQSETQDANAGEFNLTTVYQHDAVGNVIRTIDPRGNDSLATVNQLDQIIQTSSELAIGGRYLKQFFFDANDNLLHEDAQNLDENGAPEPNALITTTYTYEILNRPTLVTSETGVTTTESTARQYDANRNAIQVREGEAVDGHQPRDAVRTYYDERDMRFLVRTAESDPGQSTDELDYDGNGNLVRSLQGIESAPRLTLTSFDGYNRSTMMVDPLGNFATTHYDENGNVVSSRIDGFATSGGPIVRLSEAAYTYDALDRRVISDEAFFNEQTQGNIGDGHNVTTTAYAPNSEVVSVTDDDNHSIAMAYDNDDRPRVVTDALGNSITTTYDADGNVVMRVEVEKSDLGNPDQVFTTTFAYDNLNRMTSSTDNVGNVTQYQYDSRSNRVRTIDALGRQTEYVYDDQNRLVKTIMDMNGNGPDGAAPDVVVMQTWDDSNRLTAQIDSNGNATRYSYDSLDRLIVTQFAHGTINQVGSGATWAIGQPQPNLSGFVSGYDDHGNVVLSTDANGNVATSLYDQDNRLVQRNYNHGPGVGGITFEAFQYDGQSRLIRAQNDVSIVTRTFDSLGNMIQETQQYAGGPVAVVTSAYDGVGNRVSCTYPGGRSINTTFDALNRRKAISDNFIGPIAIYYYVGPGRVERRDFGNGTRTSYTYDGIGNAVGDFGVRQIVHTKHQLGAAGAIIDERAYLWDRVGNKMERKDVRLGGPRFTHDYQYDAANRLIHTTISNASATVVRDTNYALDRVGNRTSVSGTNTLDPGSYVMNPNAPPVDAPVNQYTSVPWQGRAYDECGNLTGLGGGACYPGDFNGDGLENALDVAPFVAALLAGTFDPCADLNGDSLVNGRDIQPFVNRLNTSGPPSQTTTIVYDSLNRQIDYIVPNGPHHHYDYDALGRRIAKIVDVNGVAGGPVFTRFLLDGWQEIEEWDVAGNTLATYVFGNYIDEALTMRR